MVTAALEELGVVLVYLRQSLCVIGREDVGVADRCIHQLLVGGGYGQLAWVWSDSITG